MKKKAKRKIAMKDRKSTSSPSTIRIKAKKLFPKKDHVHRRNATINKQAFIGLITNAIEVYKKETFGLLIGRLHKHYYHILDTVAAQSAKRSYEYVNIDNKHIERINFAMSHLSDNQLIGDYHSHPGGPDKLSEPDVDDLMHKIPTLTILVSVKGKKLKKCQPWTANADKSISGSIGSKYIVKIIAYEIDRKNRKVERIKIVCKYLKFLNKSGLYKSRYC